MSFLKESTFLRVLLIKPSKYDDDGYVNHHFRGVLPSNTLYALNALLEEAAQKIGCTLRTVMIDESVELVEPSRLMKNCGEQTLVCLVGVQTNQYPRALDLGRQFVKLGAKTIIGGFHVSGMHSLNGMTPDLKEAIESGVSLFFGEAEGRLEGLLTDALAGTVKPYYEAASYPDLRKSWPVPVAPDCLSKRFVYDFMGTIDASRGCVFQCSFCTVINVQGKTVRSRDPLLIEKHIREHYPKRRYYFFTDDNMARNKSWRHLFESIIKMKDEGIYLHFMMQVDTAAHLLPDFCKLAGEAGCVQVFIGLESLNQKNLEAAGKKQNKIERFSDMMNAWHSVGIPVHTAYIIGFPFDTSESVAEDITVLMRDVRPDQASFFMLTPLPGSADHRALLQQGAHMSSDYNEYDSFHATTDHPHMSSTEWSETYREAWRRFYSKENLVSVLTRSSPDVYWRVFKNAAWSLYAFACEGQHPMITGFWRLKGRTQRRFGFPVEGRLKYFYRRVKDSAVLSWRLAKLFMFLQGVWKETWLVKRASRIEEAVGEMKRSGDGKLKRAAARTVSAVSFAKLSFDRFAENAKKRAYDVGQEFGRLPYTLSLSAAKIALETVTYYWLFFLNFSFET